MSNAPKLLVIYPGKDVVDTAVFNLIVADTGEVLEEHVCSNSRFAYGDLYANRPDRIEAWKKRFGEFEVKYIDETTIDISVLMELNREYYSKNISDVVAFIDGKLNEIDADERFHYEAATIDTNAPLALIQLNMRAQAETFIMLRSKICEIYKDVEVRTPIKFGPKE